MTRSLKFRLEIINKIIVFINYCLCYDTCVKLDLIKNNESNLNIGNELLDMVETKGTRLLRGWINYYFKYVVSRQF